MGMGGPGLAVEWEWMGAEIPKWVNSASDWHIPHHVEDIPTNSVLCVIIYRMLAISRDTFLPYP